MEMNNFQRGVILEPSYLDDPILIEFQYILIINSAQPKVHLGIVLLHFYSQTVELCIYVFFCWDEPQQNVLPHPIALSPLEPQDKGSPVLVLLVLPYWLHLLLEEVNVWAYCHLWRSFEVLIVGPELLDRCNVGYWVQTVLEPILSLHEALIPEAKRPVKLLWFLLFLHNIQSIIYGEKWTYN